MLRSPPLLLLLLAALWSLAAASQSWTSSKDPNVRDWGDYSDLPPAVQHELDQDQDHTAHGHGGAGGSKSWSMTLAPELDFLAEFAGKLKLSSLVNV